MTVFLFCLGIVDKFMLNVSKGFILVSQPRFYARTQVELFRKSLKKAA